MQATEVSLERLEAEIREVRDFLSNELSPPKSPNLVD